MKPFAYKMGGEAGFGITLAGLSVSKIASRSGYYVFDSMEYPSIIRGGHNVVGCYISDSPVHAPYMHTDFLIAFNQEAVDRHGHELSEDAVVLYDKEFGVDASKLPRHVSALPVPFARLAREVGGTILMRNTIAVAVSVALLGGSLEIFATLIAEEFAKKGDEVVKKNQNVAEAGYNFVMDRFASYIRPVLAPKIAREQVVINANEAVSLGAVAAGLQFVAIYPMTPTSPILANLAPLQTEYGFIYKQPEDEIAAINMAIGASFAGARSMVATAGGGFCLMSEGYGLAGITEIPLVIIEGMRGAPATGLPTWTEQGDLRFMLHAHQGDFPRIVLAAGDAVEAFHLTMEAFNLADMYQTPVVLMIDKHMCESHETCAPFDYHSYILNRGKYATTAEADYQRYAPSEDGISLRRPAGTGSHVLANSDEHTPEGYSSETSENRIAQMNKRMRKLEVCREKSMAAPTVYGPADADVTIVGWGSTKGAILEALKELPNVNFVHTTWMNPFPAEAMKKILAKAKKILSVEGNYTGQFTGLISEHTGIQIENILFKYDGRPIYPEEIVKRINEILLPVSFRGSRATEKSS